jgi:hypothetical protein
MQGRDRSVHLSRANMKIRKRDSDFANLSSQMSNFAICSNTYAMQYFTC